MILITIPFWQDNSAQCEQLLDFIFAQNDRQQLRAHVSLVNAPGVDKEMVERIKISAEVAFAGVHQLEIRALADDRAPKYKAVNNVFTQSATHIHKCFRWPFLWLEPDTVPTGAGWLPRLVAAYGSQPKVYFGPRLKIETPGKPDAFLMARTAVYPVNAITDMPASDAPFEIASAVNVFPKFTITKLIQQTVINNEGDLAKVREDAILCHGDKNGFLRRKLEQEAQGVADFLVKVDAETNLIPGQPLEIKNGIIFKREPDVKVPEPSPKKKGRPSKAEIEARNAKLAEVAA